MASAGDIENIPTAAPLTPTEYGMEGGFRVRTTQIHARARSQSIRPSVVRPRPSMHEMSLT